MSDTAVAKKKKPPVEVIQIRVEADWIVQVDEMAERLQMSRSAYIRRAVQKELERDGAQPARRDEEP